MNYITLITDSGARVLFPVDMLIADHCSSDYEMTCNGVTYSIPFRVIVDACKARIKELCDKETEQTKRIAELEDRLADSEYRRRGLERSRP